MEVGKEKKECENPNLDSNPNPNPNPDSNPNPNPNPNPLTYPDPFEPTSTWGQAGVGSPAVGPPGSSSVPGSRPLPTGMYCTVPYNNYHGTQQAAPLGCLVPWNGKVGPPRRPKLSNLPLSRHVVVLTSLG